MDIKISLFASSVRPQLYEEFFQSLKSNKIQYEVVFSGNWDFGIGVQYEKPLYIQSIDGPVTYFHYYKTLNIKPAQCYEIARRECQGELVMWVADDAEFTPNLLDKIYDYWKAQNNEKLILSVQTKETGYGNPKGTFFDMRDHGFRGFDRRSPLMAPLGVMSRKFLDELGGLDRRYVCGQYENDIVMRAYAAGGEVNVFGDEHNHVWIDHLKKSIQCGECTDERGFLKRPFATGYQKDRQVLESSWYRDEKFLVSTNSGHEQVKIVSDLSKLMRYDDFEPFEDANILTKSQSNRGKWNE